METVVANDWQPLVDGRLAQRARDTARMLGDALASDPCWFATASPDLFAGAAGIALLFAYLDEVWPHAGYGDECARWMARAADGVARGLPMSLTGTVGVAWMIEHLAELDGPDPNVDVDVALEMYLAGSFEAPFDLVTGVVGLGCYALERRARRPGFRCLAAILDQLERRAQRRGAGLAWWSAPHELSPRERARCPGGNINLGIAHGQPGVLGLLARLHAIPELSARARPLLDGALAWQLARGEGTMGYWIVDDEAPLPARAAWCYGDPGVAVALLAAGDFSVEARDLAIRLARRSAALSPERAGIEDAGLCHGAAGLMHIYQRIAFATRDDSLREAARGWLHHTLALARPGRGIASFLARRSAGYEPRPGLMDGAAGIALALLAASTEIPPDWDRALLLS